MRWVWTIPLLCSMAFCSLAFGTTRYVAASAGTFSGGASVITGSVANLTFSAAETVTQATSGATATFSSITVGGSVPGSMIVTSVSGTPDSSHVWTGGTSGATFTPTATPLSRCNGQTAITVATWNSVNASGDQGILCGTVSAPAGSTNYIQFNASGTSGAPTQIVFDAGAVLTATYWSGAAILIGHNNYITINGGPNGTIQATANGTGLANQQDNGIGVDCGSVNPCSNIIVEYLTVANLYVHSCTTVIASCTDEGGGNVEGIRIFGGSNDTVTGNTVHDTHWGITMLYGSLAANSTNLLVYGNTVSNNDHGVIFGDQGANSTATGSNCSNAIYDNDISNFQPWDDAGDDFHHDGVHAWANNAPGSNYYVCVYSNSLHGDGGYNFNSFIFMESASQSSAVFNNILNLTANGQHGSSQCTGTGILGPATGSGTNGISLGVYNNTVQGWSTSDCEAIGIQEQTSPTIENNIALTANAATYVASNSGTVAWDYNTYFNIGSGAWHFTTFSAWQTAGNDVHGQNANPNLTASFTLNSGSPAIGAATNLTSLGITALDSGAPQTFGASGSCGTGCLARPSTGAWDAGAYPFSSANTYTIAISSIVGHGTVTSSDSVLNCTTGTTGTCSDPGASGTVTLTFTPAGGYSLSSVTGCTLSGNTCSLTAAATITATFTANGAAGGLLGKSGMLGQAGVK
jgi:hypothetical protein